MNAWLIILAIVFCVPVLCFVADLITIWWIKKNLKKKDDEWETRK